MTGQPLKLTTKSFGLIERVADKNGDKMTIEEAIKAVEEMPTEEFNAFFSQLPPRTQMLIKSGMVDWRRVCADWYLRDQRFVYEPQALNYNLEDKLLYGERDD